MEMLTVRLESAELEAFGNAAHKLGKTKSDLLREAVEYYIKEGRLPAPTPAPAPAPDNPPKPAPVPVPITPPDAGGGTTHPLPLPDLLHGIQQRVDVQKDRLVVRRAPEAWRAVWPKLAAAGALSAVAVAIYPSPWECALAGGAAAIGVDWIRTGPGFRLAIINRAIADLVTLSDDIPRLWAEACLTKSPAQAELDVLARVKARREAIGAACLKDLGEGFWEPEGN